MPSSSEIKMYLGSVPIYINTTQQTNNGYQIYTNLFDTNLQSDISYQQLNIHNSGTL